MIIWASMKKADKDTKAVFTLKSSQLNALKCKHS